MTREFVLTRTFERCWRTLGLTDYHLMVLQQILLQGPRTGMVVQGTGGLRKMRIPLDGIGKSGGVRVLYVDFVRF